MLTDANIPPAFQAVLDKDERVLWLGTPARVPFLLSGLPLLVFGLIWGSIDYFGFIRRMKGVPLGFAIPFFALHLLPLWAGLLSVLRLFLVHGNTCYAVTDRRLMIRSGFWGTDFTAVNFDGLVDLTVSVNPIENLFGVGSIGAFCGRTTSKGSRVYDRFVAVANPYGVFKQIKEASAAVKTDYSYPNALRPATNPGYRTNYDRR
jgi:hypothetical protein